MEVQVERDIEAFVRVQQEAGFDLLADGMLRWQDLFRPLLEASDGLEPGPLTRFLDTNTFYRAPHATTAEPRLREPLREPYLAPVPGPRLVTLPSPWALARGTGASATTIAKGVLRPQLEALAPDVELVVLEEPFLAPHEQRALDELAEALETLSGATKLALRFVFSDAGRALAQGAGDLPVDALGIDFYRTRFEDIPDALEKTLLAGVVDVRSSLAEDPGELAVFASRLQQHVADVALVPNGDLQFVAESIAREKVLRLGRAKTMRLEEAA